MEKYRIWLSIIILIASINAVFTASGQFHGEDEAMQRYESLQLIQALSKNNEDSSLEFMWYINTSSHPPLRYILSIPGLLIMPHQELGVRLGAVFFSILMTYQFCQLTYIIGGKRIAIFSGLWLAVSGVYTWTTMAFSWSVIVLMLIICIRFMYQYGYNLGNLRAKRIFTLINIAVIVAFLINTGSILFFLSTVMVYGWHNKNRLKVFMFRLIPFGLFYALYYGYFLILLPLGGATSGQYNHNLSRADATGLNVESLAFNLQALNLYLIPLFAWVVLIASLYYLWTHQKSILAWILPFIVAWSFYLKGGTDQYFLLAFIPLIPFGAIELQRVLARRYSLQLIGAGAILIVGTTALWNYAFLIHQYPETEYPYHITQAFWADGGRRHNVIIPYTEIGKLIDEQATPDSKFVHNISGAFTMFYYNDGDFTQKHHSRYAGSFQVTINSNKGCYLLQGELPEDTDFIVSKLELCTEVYIQKILIPNSTILLYII